MIVHKTNTSEADQKSARLFFDAVVENYDLSDADALDMFARNGQLTVENYHTEVKTISLWELGEEHREALEAFSATEVHIGCTYARMQAPTRQYDFIVIDSPQGIHKDANGGLHAEHFDVLRGIEPLLKDHVILVLYVNKSPYDAAVEGEHGYDKYEEYDFQRWMNQRLQFYRTDPKALTEEYALRKYGEIMSRHGYLIISAIIVPCFSDVPGKPPYAFRLALECKRARAR